ncbi:aspartate carbamoyltransferase catalytic subunit [Listeria grayi]|uniref:Aspartate carbamoyltransferase n=2 Tax=Listeria grayi TaxID=1641 RepID=D7UVF0_LISGR|nr:aspartate carbamoyltransferase catalytic subunit [Listeria grayi]EFI84631.1 aspartate carbamoyltransferase [Listeria grayi DSM 20601]STY42842.1 Aspartate carbamoyltransferase [Listeria grayi]
MKHLLTMEELGIEEIEALLDRAAAFKHQETVSLPEPKYAVNMFFEASTRTHHSFEMAEQKLGMREISFDPGHSSITKGETLYDTLLTMQAIGVDVAVIRHFEEKYYEPLRKLDISIINGGDGCGEHPSQCLLDLFTIREQFGTFKGLKVAIMGDISHSRVAHSNMKALHRLGAEVCFGGPIEWLDETAKEYGPHLSTEECIQTADVIMLLRVQHERHDSPTGFSKETYHRKYGLTTDLAKTMKPNAIIMHPSPVNRDTEIAGELVEAKQSRIVEQMTNGVFIRMAILAMVLKEKETRVKACTF